MAGTDDKEAKITLGGMKELLSDHRLLIFAACVVLFFLSSAATLPLAATQITKGRPDLADILIAVTIVVPQIITAALAPWVGRSADRRGRRPIMLLGWSMLPLQGLLYASQLSPFLLLVCQMLSGISAAVFGVTMTLVAADLTRASGRFNLTLGSLGVAIAAGASVSTTLAGVTASWLGDRAAFLFLALAGLAGVLLLWFVMPETATRPYRSLNDREKRVQPL